MSSRARIGTTSYGFRYLLSDERRAPPLPAILRRVAQLGLDAFQVCENARPLAPSGSGWRDAVVAARDCNIELHVGCMTLSADTLSRYLELAAAIPDNQVRIVLEDERGNPPSRASIAAFLDAAAPALEAAGMTLAIENHFHVHYHLKDYRVRGSNVGFDVGGAPLGEGDLDLTACVRRIAERHAAPLVFLENWTPSSGGRDEDAARDAEWLSRSLAQARRSFLAGVEGGGW
jgi:sugar phosphate isomerase/epimerase